ncbi:hypothetical protein PC118_g20671 [Phytophthora cactorum]|uniref:Uncharacterized protein n=1 Tax=Phytophthora cactorum TaxID=29920 RepID=A0A8T1EYK9_9STRA|nr:hypothetical protein PC118_g20671 [Phytophthora cactorum]
MCGCRLFYCAVSSHDWLRGHDLQSSGLLRDPPHAHQAGFRIQYNAPTRDYESLSRYKTVARLRPSGSSCGRAGASTSGESMSKANSGGED